MATAVLPEGLRTAGLAQASTAGLAQANTQRVSTAEMGDAVLRNLEKATG